LNLPLVAVNHLEGHIHAVLLEHPGLEFPALAMVVSGGHTHMFSTTQTGPSQFSYRLVGRTRDDAAGEAFDKVAKLLGLGYPGGPAIDRLAPHGNPRAVRFTTAKMKGNALDFSFSGIKTAVLRHVQAAGSGMEEEIARRKHFLEQNPRPSIEAWLAVLPRPTLDLIASFQYTVVAELVRHAVAAAERENARSLIISGGVACNTQLREAFRSELVSWPVYFPTPKLSTDNAAMIAAAAYPKLVTGNVADLALAAQASLPL
jgi:N6-L-threonylcarbamoyladenine synthase